MRKARRNFVLLALLLLALLMTSCASIPKDGGKSLKPPLATENQEADDQEVNIPTFSMFDEGTGIFVQYSIASIVRKDIDGNVRRIGFLIDPAEEYTLDPMTEIVYFRLEIFNPMEEELFFEQRMNHGDFSEKLTYKGGNVVDCVFMFKVDLEMVDQRNEMSVAVIFQGIDLRVGELETDKFVFLAPVINEEK